MCSALAQAWKTRSRGAGKTLETTRGSGLIPFFSLAVLAIAVLFVRVIAASFIFEIFEISTQPVEPLLPLRPPCADPLLHEAQRLGLDPAHPDAAYFFGDHEPRAFQDRQ